MKLLTASHISHAFDYDLFTDISFTVNSGDKIAITGVSGSGKSTLLHILSTLLTPQKGSVEILGQDLMGLSNKDLVKLRSKEIGIVFQSHYLFKGFSGLENIEVAAMLSEQEVDHALFEQLGITDVIDNKISDLSGGQQQRVSIARVLTKKPRLIFADEPTGNLDAKTAKEVIDIFEKYVTNHDAAFIVVTHDEAIASRCDRVFHLENRELSQVQ